MRTQTLALLVVGAVVLVMGWSLGGCSSTPVATNSPTSAVPPPDVGASPTASSVRVTTVDASTSTLGEPSRGRPEIARLFAELAGELAPLPVYGLAELPPELSIPAQWWPAISYDSPEAYDGPRVLNPHVSDSPPGTQEAQVLLKLGGGWLMIVENFRGDLGDVPGISVGNVAGRPAELYALSEGILVQWRDHGMWYGVFGRGVDAEEVVQTALSLVVTPPAD